MKSIDAKTGEKNMLHKISVHEMAVATRCPRCSSTRIYSDENEFVCLSCSFVALAER